MPDLLLTRCSFCVLQTSSFIFFAKSCCSLTSPTAVEARQAARTANPNTARRNKENFYQIVLSDARMKSSLLGNAGYSLWIHGRRFTRHWDNETFLSTSPKMRSQKTEKRLSTNLLKLDACQQCRSLGLSRRRSHPHPHAKYESIHVCIYPLTLRSQDGLAICNKR